MKYIPGRVVRLWNDEITPYETERTVEAIEKLIAQSPDELITLEIYSGGGKCEAGFALCDWISLNKIPLQTVGYGQVSSMAIPIFLMGSHRVLSVNCTMTLHPMQSVLEKEQSYEGSALAKQITQIEDWQARYLDHLSRYILNSNREKIKKLVDKSTTLDAQKAKKLGFAHEVLGL